LASISPEAGRDESWSRDRAPRGFRPEGPWSGVRALESGGQTCARGWGREKEREFVCGCVVISACRSLCALRSCVCVCVCVCVRARHACVRACARVRACVRGCLLFACFVFSRKHGYRGGASRYLSASGAGACLTRSAHTQTLVRQDDHAVTTAIQRADTCMLPSACPASVVRHTQNAQKTARVPSQQTSWRVQGHVERPPRRPMRTLRPPASARVHTARGPGRGDPRAGREPEMEGSRRR